MRQYTLYILIFFSMLLGSCVYPYNPELTIHGDDIIVIEGDILAGEQSIFEITYCQDLGEKSEPESVNANLWVESNSGDSYPAIKTIVNSNYIYSVDTKNLDLNKKYRVHVVPISSQDVYYSNWLSILITPPIDSISYIIQGDNERMFFNISTHGDDQNRYYRWSYTEDWEYHSYYFSYLEYNVSTNEITDILGIKNRYYCWNDNTSSEIMVANTSSLVENRLVNQELYSIPRTSLKISYIYSVEISQKAITKESYIYWNTLAKNSDEAGGLFSPQPSELRGNIVCTTDTTKVALGYISASTVEKQRKYVYNADTRFYRSQIQCEDAIALPEDMWSLYYMADYDIVYSEDLGGSVDVYWAKKRCVDCTVQGGSKNKPSFWPNDHK